MKLALNHLILVVVCFWLTTPFAHAQRDKVTITPLTWADEQDLKSKMSYINGLARSRLGSEFHTTQSDLKTLQRLVDGKFLPKDDRQKLQSTGVILGNLIKNELGQLEWMVYEDFDRNGKEQRSRALCVKNSDQCLFPTTMISRRIEVDAPVNVQSIYDNAVAIIKPAADSAHPYQPSKLVRPEYVPPEKSPKEPSKNINVQFK